MAVAIAHLHKSVNRRTLIFFTKVNIFGLGLLGLWTAIDTTLLPTRVSQTAPSSLAGTGLGLISIVGVGLAIIVQPVAGRLSDAWPNDDRRRPFILAGLALVTPGLVLFGMAPSYVFLMLGFVLMQLATNIAQAGFQALIPDLAAESERGAASAAKNALSVLGAAVGLLGAEAVLSTTGSVGLALSYLWALIVATGLLTVYWTPGDSGKGRKSEMTLKEAVNISQMLGEFKKTFIERRVLRLAVVAQFLFMLGSYPAQRFLLLFLRDRFGNSATRSASLGGAAAIVLAIAGAGVAGGLSDLIGRKKVLIGGVVIGGIGLFFFGFSPTLSFAGLSGGLIAIGLGAFLSVNWALMTDDLPAGQSAAALGVANIATAGAGTVAGLFGPLVDGLNVYFPQGAYQVLFALAGIVAVTSLVPLARVDSSHAKPASNRPMEAIETCD